jgi:hypothetical protein
MGQYHVVVNLSKKEYLYPRKFNDGVKLMEFGASGCGTMMALGWLLGNDWNGDHVTIVGDYGDQEDHNLDFLASLRIKLGESDLYDVVTASYGDTPKAADFKIETVDQDGKTVKKTDRVALATAKLFTDVSERTIDAMVASGVVTFKEKDGYTRFGNVKRNASTEFSILVNEENGEALDPRVFGDSARLLSFAQEGFGGTMTALATLLASSCKGGGRGGGDIHADPKKVKADLVGSWADCRISLKKRSEMKYCKDISLDVRAILEAANEASYETDASGKVTRKFPEWY